MTEELNRFGLCKVGNWVTSSHQSVEHLRTSCPTGINYVLSAEWRTARDVVYALVFRGTAPEGARYVGETTAGLASRFNGYRYGNPLVTDTDNRVKLAITAALSVEGGVVEIWACCPSVYLKLPDGEESELPGSKPLEEHLIGLLQPDLNEKNLKAGAPARSSTRQLQLK